MNAVHVRNQKHELTPPRNSGYKKVTAFSPRNIEYKQDRQLFGLRDKPVTQQDALPNSEVPTKIIRPGRTRCLPTEASPLSSYMPWQYQSSHDHSNPLEQTFPTFTTSFDRLLDEMQNLNKSMEARQEVGEQCEENPSMPTHHARAGVTANAWAKIATGSNATTTSHDAAKSDATANSTESDAENDTLTLMLKHEPINCSHPQFSRQPCGIKETTCPGSKYTFCLGSEEVVCHGNEELACPGSTEATCLGSPEVARPGSRQAACPCSTEAACPGSTQAACLGSTEPVCPVNTCPGSTEAACPGSTEAFCPRSTRTACLGGEEIACPGSTKASCPGSTETACPGRKQIACLGNEEPVCLGSTEATCPGSTETTHPGNIEEFCHGGEQNDCFVSTSLSDMMTGYLENEAHSMVIPPTICAAPQSLLMEMFKKSEDNDTWKIDDFKKNVPSIDFQRILAEDCHGNWLEQQLPQQRRLHPTMLEVNANEVIKWLDVVIIFPNHMFMPSGTIARWSVYRHFKGERNKDTSTMAAQTEVSEIPLAQDFLGRIVTRWRVRMDYKKYRKRPTFLDYLGRTTINIDLPAQVPAAAYYQPKIPAHSSCRGITTKDRSCTAD
ncbi:hypothetical protein V6N12_065746 [Hibiscus sabdariffa]|uniref:Uncharacterized protein n=1 Tax=Hibiscus sabdariffa TaxID=183260 RepID=A0ABR2GAM9_9ROSI